jgi:hypothetical protein
MGRIRSDLSTVMGKKGLIEKILTLYVFPWLVCFITLIFTTAMLIAC